MKRKLMVLISTVVIALSALSFSGCTDRYQEYLGEYELVYAQAYGYDLMDNFDYWTIELRRNGVMRSRVKEAGYSEVVTVSKFDIEGEMFIETVPSFGGQPEERNEYRYVTGVIIIEEYIEGVPVEFWFQRPGIGTLPDDGRPDDGDDINGKYLGAYILTEAYDGYGNYITDEFDYYIIELSEDGVMHTYISRENDTAEMTEYEFEVYSYYGETIIESYNTYEGYDEYYYAYGMLVYADYYSGEEYYFERPASDANDIYGEYELIFAEDGLGYDVTGDYDYYTIELKSGGRMDVHMKMSNDDEVEDVAIWFSVSGQTIRCFYANPDTDYIEYAADTLIDGVITWEGEGMHQGYKFQKVTSGDDPPIGQLD